LRPLSMSARFLAAVVGVVVLLGQPRGADGWGARAAVAGPCSCDCCLTELQRGSMAANGDSKLQCAYAPPSEMSVRPALRRGAEARCGTMCSKSAGDKVLVSADGAVDTQRFCFFECQPDPQDSVDKPENPAPEVGDPCGPLSSNEIAMVTDAGGNARPPMEVPNVMSHFLLARKSTKAAIKRVETIVKQRQIPPAPKPAAQAWMILTEPALKQGAAVAGWAQEAEKDALDAYAALKAVNEVASGAVGGLAAASSAAAKAKKAAEQARKAEDRVRAIKEGLFRRAKEAAMSAIPETVRKLKESSMKKAKEEALAQAKIAQEKMETDGPIAYEEAMKPYEDTVARIGDLSNKYLAAGDLVAKQSTELQTAAQVSQTQASNYMRIGAIDDAQKKMVQAKQMMNMAVTVNKQAMDYYDVSATIEGQVPEYEFEGRAAGYHAEVLVNPDAPPHPPPAVTPF